MSEHECVIPLPIQIYTKEIKDEDGTIHVLISGSPFEGSTLALNIPGKCELIFGPCSLDELDPHRTDPYKNMRR